MRIAIIWLLLFSLSWSNRTVCGWQIDNVDPFSTDESNLQPIQETANEPSIDLVDSLDEGVRLIVQSVRESNPKTPVEIARALKSMMNLQQYSEAKRYLDQLIASSLTGSQFFELNEVMGPAFFLELRRTAELAPSGKAFAELVIRSAKDEAYASDRIAALISELSDDSRFTRQEAFRKLKLLGDRAIPVMLEVCEDQNRRKEIPFIQSALKQMGEPAIMPMIGAARADGTVAQAVAVGALSNIQSELATDAILRASISNRVPKSVRNIAAEAVSRRGYRSESEIKNRIYKRAIEYLENRVNLPVIGNDQTQIWNWKFSDDKLAATTAPIDVATRIMSVDLARDLYTLESDNQDYRRLQILTVLSATKRVLGPNRFTLFQEVASFVSDLDTWDLDQALGEAMKRKYFASAIAAAEVLGQVGDMQVLFPTNGKQSNLIKAVISGHRRLQFAAVKSIDDIDPKQSFPGCSYVTQVIAQMANSDGSAAAVAVHPNAEASQALASSIYQSGFVGLTARGGVELFSIIQKNPDVEFVVITDSLARPHFHELVQQLRAFWLSSEMPIALLVRNAERERSAERLFDDDPLTLVLPYTTNPKLVFEQMNRLANLRAETAASNVQRNQHADFAFQWVQKILQDQKTYRFYGIETYRDQLVDIMQSPAAFQAKSMVLKKIGTPKAQRRLVNLAGDSGLSKEDRKMSAIAFADSVGSHGILLNRGELNEQYDLFDASRTRNDGAQEALQIVIDAIETRSKRR